MNETVKVFSVAFIVSFSGLLFRNRAMNLLHTVETVNRKKRKNEDYFVIDKTRVFIDVLLASPCSSLSVVHLRKTILQFFTQRQRGGFA